MLATTQAVVPPLPPAYIRQWNVVVGTMTEAEWSEFAGLPPAAAVSYREMRAKGESHNMAMMLASRKFPGLRTDSEFNKGRFGDADQFALCPLRGAWLKAEAAKAGVSTTGKYYSGGLARFPGDPRAWIDSRADVLAICKQEGWSSEGSVNYQPGEREPTAPDIDIADDILQREVDEVMALDPGHRREDVTERVREVLTGAVDEHAPLVQE